MYLSAAAGDEFFDQSFFTLNYVLHFFQQAFAGCSFLAVFHLFQQAFTLTIGSGGNFLLPARHLAQTRQACRQEPFGRTCIMHVFQLEHSLHLFERCGDLAALPQRTTMHMQGLMAILPALITGKTDFGEVSNTQNSLLHLAKNLLRTGG